MKSTTRAAGCGKRPRTLAGAALALTLCALGTSAQSFHRLESVTTLKSAAPEWDYVALDAPRGRLFIARRGDGVTVFDVNKRKPVRTLDNSADANATVLAPDLDRGFTVNGDGTATMFRMSTLKSLGRIKFGADADSGFYDPVTKQIALTMGDSHAVAFMDARTGALLGTLPVDSNKLDGTAPDGEGNLFMALRDRNAVIKIDMAAHKVAAEFPTMGCDQPTAVDYDRATRRIFVGCRGKLPVLAVLDATSGKVVATLEIGRGTDGVIFDPSTRTLYTANGVDANLVIYRQVDADHYQFEEATTTRPYARTMALDPKTKKVYMVTAEGTADPAAEINRGVAPFYPNKYFRDTFMVLTYAPQ